MSIYDEIVARVNEHRLFLLSPAIPGGIIKRRMYVAAEVVTLIHGPWQDTAWAERCGYLLADFDRFILGEKITVAASTYGSNASNLKLLDPPRDEVWEIRCRNPNPGIRVFGRFAEKDLFVALTWAKRPDLEGPKSRQWRDAKEACNAEWRKLFPVYPPLSGVNHDDYLSNAVPI